MSIVEKNYRITQKIAEDEFLVLHPETKAENVILDETDVKSKIAEITQDIEAIESNYAQKSELPVNVSELANDSGFITKAVNDLTNYYLKSETYTQAEIDARLSAIPKFKIEVVAALPTADIGEATIYLVKTSDESENMYTEFIYSQGAWEELGTQKLDLTGYARETYVDNAVEALNNELATVAKSGQFADLAGRPTKLSDLTDDTATTPIAKAGEAGKLTTGRTITIAGDASGSATFDGTSNVTINVALGTTGIAAGSYSAFSVDNKGRVTAGAQLIEVGTQSQTTPENSLAVGGLFFQEI